MERINPGSVRKKKRIKGGRENEKNSYIGGKKNFY
jgi:hypothetical protein